MLEFIGVHASGPQQAAAFGCQVRGGGRQAAVFIDQDHGKLIRAEIAKRNIMAFEHIFDNGYRQITTSTRPIRTPEDLREMVWFDTGYHEIFNEAEPLRGEVLAALTDWLRRHLEAPAKP